MNRRFRSFRCRTMVSLLMIAIALSTTAPALSSQQPGSEDTAGDSAAVYAKSQVSSLGLNLKVTVIRNDGSKANGTILQINHDSFVLSTHQKRSSQIDISYADVSSVQSRKSMSPAMQMTLLSLLVVGTVAGTAALLDYEKAPIDGVPVF